MCRPRATCVIQRALVSCNALLQSFFFRFSQSRSSVLAPTQNRPSGSLHAFPHTRVNLINWLSGALTAQTAASFPEFPLEDPRSAPRVSLRRALRRHGGFPPRDRCGPGRVRQGAPGGGVQHLRQVRVWGGLGRTIDDREHAASCVWCRRRIYCFTESAPRVRGSETRETPRHDLATSRYGGRVRNRSHLVSWLLTATTVPCPIPIIHRQMPTNANRPNQSSSASCVARRRRRA